MDEIRCKLWCWRSKSTIDVKCKRAFTDLWMLPFHFRKKNNITQNLRGCLAVHFDDCDNPLQEEVLNLTIKANTSMKSVQAACDNSGIKIFSKVTFRKVFGKQLSFLSGHWYPMFWTFGNVKARVNPPVFFVFKIILFQENTFEKKVTFSKFLTN